MHRAMRKAFVTTATVLILATCTEVRIAQPTPEGRLAVLGPNIGFDLSKTNSDWVVVGNAHERVAVDEQGPVPALIVSAGAESLTVVRRIEAHLLATPYLSWVWSLNSTGSIIHPLRLVVGFTSINEDSSSALFSTTGEDQSSPLPVHDRALTLVWGKNATDKDTLTTGRAPRDIKVDGEAGLTPNAKTGMAPRYTVRGGVEDSGLWWLETVDLAALYAKAWPQDNLAQVRIAFIGFATAPSELPFRGRVGSIQLSH